MPLQCNEKREQCGYKYPKGWPRWGKFTSALFAIYQAFRTAPAPHQLQVTASFLLSVKFKLDCCRFQLHVSVHSRQGNVPPLYVELVKLQIMELVLISLVGL